MAKIDDQLQTLLDYFLSTRQVGHSRLVQQGTETQETPCFVIVHSIEAKANLSIKSSSNVIPVTLNELLDLRGRYYPMVFDNFALVMLFRDALNRINKLKDRCKELESK